jgi:5-formyltetrahydrofolate cyclo-ligase
MDTKAIEELRREFLAKRDSVSQEERELRSRIIMVKIEVLEPVAEGSLVSCYLPAGSEVNTLEFISNLLTRGRRVAVPVHTDAGLEHSEIDSVEGLIETPGGRLALPPERIRPVKPSEFEAVIVPGVVYGTDGARVGYGEGLYGALLNEVQCMRVAPVYDFQLTTRLTWSEGEPRVDHIFGETVSYDTVEGDFTSSV